MVDLISPGVQVKEKDLTTAVRAEPTSIGGFCGIFAQGPVDEVVTIDSELTLANVSHFPSFSFL